MSNLKDQTKIEDKIKLLQENMGYFLTNEQIKELEYKGIYDIEIGRDQIRIVKYNSDTGEEYEGYESVDPNRYVMRIDDATVVLDPTYDNILESVIIYEAPSVWYGISRVLKVIEMINQNKSQKKN